MSKALQQVGAFGDGRFGIGQFPAQVGKGAVGFVEHDVVGIVLGGGRWPWGEPVFARDSCHLATTRFCGVLISA